jgi:hypothetical protein
MTDDQFKSIFGLSQKEKEDLVKAVSQDVTVGIEESQDDTDDELYDYETHGPRDLDQQLFDNEMFQNDTDGEF